MKPRLLRTTSVFAFAALALLACSKTSADTTAAPTAEESTASSSETTAAAEATTDAAASVETSSAAPAKRDEIVLLAYDSFALSKGTIEGFTASTGIPVKVVTQGDAGELVNSAILTKDSPESGVLWGVDSTLLTRAIDAKIFTPYESTHASELDPKLRSLAPGNEVTPVDRGDVCVNYDKAALAKRGVQPPTSLADLADPKYKGMLVTQNPATSSPGLAFLFASIAKFGEDPATGWKDYWTKLRANDVKVVSGWTEAYETWFSAGGGKGDRPLVVSYGTSPAAAVLFGPDPKATEAPTGVVESTCYRQVEFAGVLNGPHTDEAKELLDFLVSTPVQEDLQLNMFVYPSNTTAKIADEFTRFGVSPADSLELAPDAVSKGRETWTDEWTSILG